MNSAKSQHKILISANGSSLSATLADNVATDALIDLLAKGPISVAMEDYGGFEKVGELPQSLPTDNRQITTSAGDIMLYLGRNIVIFYGSNSWSYTPLGKIDNASPDEIRRVLEGNPAEVTISSATTQLDQIDSDIDLKPEKTYDLSGKKVDFDKASPGVYISNGRKIVKR